MSLHPPSHRSISPVAPRAGSHNRHADRRSAALAEASRQAAESRIFAEATHDPRVYAHFCTIMAEIDHLTGGRTEVTLPRGGVRRVWSISKLYAELHKLTAAIAEVYERGNLRELNLGQETLAAAGLTDPGGESDTTVLPDAAEFLGGAALLAPGHDGYSSNNQPPDPQIPDKF